ncbi:hypothetical protein [Flammeovirga sp. SubArs3]|uniref:hypothetical protein n=1 Tax=Flammeovirga sp. SubArs3 TaxID=2995316 RepID=UPI00248ACF2B|nr:hypothetical protein [Flammeovirga sp. SubArs3]
MNSIKYKDFKTHEKAFFIGLIIWIFLQTTRFIAFSLIDEINNGGESLAWMYPAFLDIFAAVLAFPLIAALCINRGLSVWSMSIIYLSISIVDHFGNFTTTTFVGPPSIVEEGMDPLLVPIIQTVLDFIFLILLFIPTYRNLFFKLKTSND